MVLSRTFFRLNETLHKEISSDNNMKDNKQGKYLINDVSLMVNLSQKRIREYEKEGFVKPVREARTSNRIYDPFDILQIKRVNYLLHEKGFTLACLRKLLALAPCYKIFCCKKKETCPAYLNPHRPCWEVRSEIKDSGGCQPHCCRCAVYLNRSVAVEKILEKEHEHW